MNDFERRLDDWLNAPEAHGMPADLLDNVLRVTRTARQRRSVVHRIGALIDERFLGRARTSGGLRMFALGAVLAAAISTAVVAAGSIGLPSRPSDGGLLFNMPDGALAIRQPDATITVLSAGDRREGCGAFSPDGSSIAFLSGPRFLERGFRLTVAGVEPGAARRVLAPEWSARALFGVAAPSWSPDGSALVASLVPPAVDIPNDDIVVARADGSGWDVIVAGVRISEGVPIPEGLYDMQSPRWSPDGEWIAFRGRIRDGSTLGYVLAIVRPDGSDLRFLKRWPLTGSLEWGTIAWSPDSRRIAYARRPDGASEGGFDVHLVDMDGNDRRLAATAEAEFVAEWSPDGTRLAALQMGPGSAPLRIFETTTGSFTDIVVPGHVAGATWSADGRRLAVMATTGGGTGPADGPIGSLWEVSIDSDHPPIELATDVAEPDCEGMGSGISWQRLAR